MRNYYLFEQALQVGTVNALEQGLISLNSILIDRNTKEDFFLCNETIWECDTTQGKIYDLYSGIVNDELQRVIPFIFSSFHSQDNIYNDPIQIDSDFPNDCNAFIGFEFYHTNIQVDRQVNDKISYDSFVSNCLKYGLILKILVKMPLNFLGFLEMGILAI